MGRPKKVKLTELKQVHGKVEDFKATSLEQIWGFNANSLYGTLEEDVYKGKVWEMTRADLENHARSIGVLVVEDSNRLRESLMKQFRSYVISLRHPSESQHKQTKISSAAQKVLNEGR